MQRFHTFKLLIYGKLTFALCIIAFLQVQASAFAQLITLRVKDASVEEVLQELKKQGGYKLLYNDAQLAAARPVSISVKDATVEEVLKLCFAGQPLDYTIRENTIVIKPRSSTVQSAFTVKGKVVGENNEPLPGVNVAVKGTSKGTATRDDGSYVLSVPVGDETLVFSFIGYISQEVPIQKRSTVDAKLAVENKALTTLVVVGYGVQKKATLTGSVASVNSAEINTTKNESVLNMLTGKVPGLRIVQNSSEPGSFDNNFDIRGLGAPLMIIDGIPRDNIARLDPNDIENISVLKDASAAVYGVRAANGVVLVTTKRGKTGRQLTYNGTYTWQTPSGLPRSLDAIGYMTLVNEKLMHNVNGGRLAYTDADFEAYRNGSKQSTDWYSPVIKNVVPQMQHNLNASGGSEDISYYVSLGYMEQQGFLRTGDLNYKRYNVRSNITGKVTKDLSVELNVTGILDQKNQPYQDSWWIIRSFWRQNPLEPVYANNNPEYLAHTPVDGTNPVAMSDKNISGYKVFMNRWFQSSVSATYQAPFLNGLKFKGMYSYDYNSYTNKLYQQQYNQYTYDGASDVYTARAQQSPSNLRREYFERPNTLFQLSATYDHKFNSVHDVSALLLYENYVRSGDNFYAQRELSLAVDQLMAGNSTNQQGNMSSSLNDLYRNANRALVGRLNYAYKSKYLLEASFRRDGSSKFPEDKRFGFFPGASVGWRISEEGFWKNSPALRMINNLKIRASYGELGDDGAIAYQFITGYLYPAAGNNNELPPGHIFDREFINSLESKGIPNPYITWFVAKTANIGIDIDAWRGLLGVTVDVFRRNGTGLLTTRAQSLPGVVGAALPQENLNSNRSQGIEVEVNHGNKIGEFVYYAKAIYSYTRTRNRYVERSAAGNSYENWRQNSNNRFNNARWGLGAGGRFGSWDDILSSKTFVGRGTLPGDYSYEDWNGDGMISDLDVHPIAYNGIPMVNYGLTLGGSWRGIDLNLLIQGASLVNIGYNEQLRESLWGGGSGLALFLDRWHPEDPKADPYDPNIRWIPGKYGYTGTVPDENSGFNVQDASYVRLKSAEIGYSLPEKLAQRIGLHGVRAFINGYNLITITDIKYVDPEHPATLYSYLYPLNRTFSVGLNVKF
ncbi:TonB-dependent receptor [Chitinophaga barathri]|uniref:SusC/RagA family TonB-linked outer membrane protein n=1 Tax=Chitinophaga barathri TaxID=1647451 RepID=A0A3N4MC22_9BACT|nr:TonB-dependent receptor [Chitinophaga barathri]RPD41211.1 SusC/RagA family TonB-linked outer membrane protein [Chitinophaga barathri]